LDDAVRSEAADVLPFPGGNGELARLIATRDWSASLGPIETWPHSLRTTVGTLIFSPVPIVLLWGADGIMLYNDAYSHFAGGRHPTLLGSKVREGWPEVADFNDNVMRVGLAGGTLSYKDQELTLHRSGRPEQVWMNLDYSPVIDESGKPGGVIAIVVETTERVLAERAVVADRERLAQMFRAAPSFMAQLDGPDHVFAFTNAAYQQLIGGRDVIGRPIRDALPEVVEQGFVELLDRVYANGESFTGRGSRVVLKRDASAAPEAHILDFIYQPVRNAIGEVTGIFVEGIDVSEAHTVAIRRDALVRLTDRMRESQSPLDIQFEAARILGETLEVSRAGYGTIDRIAETITIERDWNAPGIRSLAGILQFREYGTYIEDLKRDDTVTVANVREDPRTSDRAAALEAIGAASFVNMPLSEQGGVVALLYLNHATPRTWKPDELAFMREVAERTRTAVERRRAEALLRANESRLRFLDALTKATAQSRDADDILSVTTRMLGDHAGVAICAYADMDDDEDGFTIRGDWNAPGSPSILGHYRLADFGRLAVSNLRAGRPLIINNNLAELAPEEAATFQAIGITATICMPLLREGRLTALMAIHDKEPRRWTANEQALLTEVAERSWAHIERVGAEADLRASEERFRTLAQAMLNHVWIASADGIFEWFNDQTYRYGGAEPGSLAGLRLPSLVHRDDVAAAASRWADALARGAIYETEFRLRRYDGPWRWHLARAVPILDDAGAIVRWVGTSTDIEDQKEAAAVLGDLNATLEERVEERTTQLRKTEEALRQAQKMEAVGQLTGGLAHDFNNLLQGISGSIDRAQHRIGAGRLGDAERFLATAMECADRAAALTHRLLAFSRRQTLDPRPTDVNRLIAGMEELIRRTMGPNIAVEVVGAGGLWATKVDAPQLESALLNLCINARDAMPNGGNLTIETANKWLDERAASDRDLPPGQYVSLCVTDTGTGMTPDVVSRAFDPFFTTKPLGQGTGLGLSMIYGFARQSGGQVRIYTEVDQGTTMCLYLPRHLGQVASATSSEDAEIDRGFGETVLVVEDEASVRTLIAEVLAESHYNVVEASDATSALRVLESDRSLDLLVTDVGLPGGMNGRQVAEAARGLRPGLKVLFITGYAENAVVGNGHLEPGMEILTKPFAMATLSNKVRRMLES
jgi:PAS domain S-box-containing protein